MLRKLLNNKVLRFFSKPTSRDVIGIDLGNSYTTVAIVEADQAKIVENNEGFRATPSVVAFNKDNQILVGSAAKRQAIAHAQNTFTNIRNLLGRKFTDPIIQNNIGENSPKAFENENEDVLFITSSGKTVSPVEILSHLFLKIKEGTEGGLDKKITDAVVSVPVYFNTPQKQAIKDAAALAGLKVLSLVSEPIAACFAYGLNNKTEGRAFVYDMGGDSFDSAIVQIKNGMFEVQATNSLKTIGGDHIDNILADLFLTEFKNQTKIDLSKDKNACQRIVEAAEKSKIELSTLIQSDVNLPYLTADETGPKHFSFVLKRAKLESVIDSFLKKTIESCQETLNKSGLEKSQIDEVLLVGGGSKMPIVRSTVESFFEKQTNKLVNPDEAVALGAAIQATVLMGNIEDVLLMEVAPLSIGLESVGGLFIKLIERGTPFPTINKFVIGMSSNNQTKAMLKFYTGERELAHENKLLCEFELNDLHPIKRGVSEVEVVLEIDESGNVKVSAKDKLTGNDFSFKGKLDLGISVEDVDLLLKKADECKKEDELIKAQIKGKLNVDELVCKLENTIEEIKQTFGKEELDGYFALLKQTKESLEKDDVKGYLEEKEKIEVLLMEIEQKTNQKFKDDQEIEEEQKIEGKNDAQKREKNKNGTVKKEEEKTEKKK